MYQEKKPDASGQMRAAAGKKRGILLLCLALILCISVGGTVAYLADRTADVTNTFSPSVVSTKVNEQIDGIVKKNVTVTNTGDTAAYIRAAIIINWVDGQGNIHGEIPEECSHTITYPAQSNWTENGGYYYYNAAVAAGATTSSLIEQVQVGADIPEDYYLQVTILSSGVQAEPGNVVSDVWGYDPDGSN